ncbi:uncharacterized protein [Paramisgurnus dabryanus]|uniref:uncharacterized protein n=1 Tax=Paramisgurnus dabryanus TaxID=90735 RepID=UPI0031F3785B
MKKKKEEDLKKRKMLDKWHIYLLGLTTIYFLNYLTGTSGEKVINVFCSDGVNVTLPCINAPPDCTWFYSKGKETGVDLFPKGIKIMDHERLSLGSDCSLNIYKTTKEDPGLYTCRQQVVRNDPYTDANVYLHVLHVSLSSTQTEIKAGNNVTISCQLYLYDGYNCESLLHKNRFQMIWVNESDVNLQSDSRYQISSSTKHCNSRLTTTLLNEDNNRELRCQIITGTEVKTSDRYTVKYSVTKIDVLYTVIPAVSAVVVSLLALLLLWLFCNKRPGKRKMAQDSYVSNERTNPAVCEMNSSFNPLTVEKNEDVAYAEINHKKGLTDRHNVQCDDKVTYMTIRGETVGHQAI